MRTEASVSRIRTKDQRAVGVVLANGDEIDADLVLSSVDPRRTFLGLLDPRELPSEFVDQVKRYRFRGASAKVNFALTAPAIHGHSGPGILPAQSPSRP
jgi:phytoene dehydrogenase-like protein